MAKAKFPEITAAAKHLFAVDPGASIPAIRERLIVIDPQWSRKIKPSILVNAEKRPVLLPKDHPLVLRLAGQRPRSTIEHMPGDRNGDGRLVPVTCLSEVVKLRQRFDDEEILDALASIREIQAVKLCTVTSHVTSS